MPITKPMRIRFPYAETIKTDTEMDGIKYFLPMAHRIPQINPRMIDNNTLFIFLLSLRMMVKHDYGLLRKTLTLYSNIHHRLPLQGRVPRNGSCFLSKNLIWNLIIAKDMVMSPTHFSKKVGSYQKRIKWNRRSNPIISKSFSVLRLSATPSKDIHPKLT